MKILVINSGSSSLKYQLIDMDNEQVLCKGLCERIGIEGGSVTHNANGGKWTVDFAMPTHAEAFSKMLELMTTGEGAVLQDKTDIGAIGHRVVHGGEKFSKSVRIDDTVLKAIEDLSPLAPLHNPPQVQGIRSAQEVFGKEVPQVAVFDTAFHQTMEPKAFIFAVPYEFYENNSIRRYGFHGTSHRYVSERAAELLGKDRNNFKVVTCHLGNGASMAAVCNGKSVDTTMGLTPLGGLMMGTRSGDLDPSVATYLADITGKYGAEMSNLLNTKSGFLGVSGISSDNRDIEEASAAGNQRAKLVEDMYSYQIKKYIGAYAAAMNGLDCVVFTGGIGENSVPTRRNVCQNMEYLGIEIDENLNNQRGKDFDFSTKDSKVRSLVILTNEELMIARDTLALA